MVDIELYGF